MNWVKNDGGRAAAGFEGRTGDCVTRALAIAMERPYAEVYADMAAGNKNERITKRTSKAAGKRSARNGIYTSRKWFKDYMARQGWKWTPCMAVGQGCTVHLNENELPKGRLIVAVSKHYTCVVDGVIHDTFNPSDRAVTVYPPYTRQEDLPKGARPLSNGDGWVYSPERCVYGYWSKQEAS
jgi:hypothetical protein